MRFYPEFEAPFGARLHLLIGAIAVTAMIGAAYVLDKHQARPNATIVAVFPLWWSHERAFTAASASGVRIMGAGALPNTLIVTTDSATGLGDMYRAGAWSLLRLDAAGGCIGLPEGAATS